MPNSDGQEEPLCNRLLKKLEGDDRRSIGQVVADLSRNGSLISKKFERWQTDSTTK